MRDVFISYSRKDKSFVEKLHWSLETHDRDTWVDWDDIPLTGEWWSEIQRGIEEANTFVFVLSPDSLASSVCGDEITHATRHNKRLIPIVYRDVDVTRVHPALQPVQWILFRESDPFQQRFEELLTAMDRDLEHVRSHTRLELRAIEWRDQQRNESFVLRGDDLSAAEIWLQHGELKEPKPTELQRDYIRASRSTEEAMQIVLKAGQKAKRLVRVGFGVLALTLLGSVGVGWWSSRLLAEAQAGIRLERDGAVALKRFEFDQTEGLLLAMRSGFELQTWVHHKSLEQYPAINPTLALQSILDNSQETRLQHQGFVQALALSPDGKQIATTEMQISTTGGEDIIRIWDSAGKQLSKLKGHQGSVYGIAFSPDGKQIATAGKDGIARIWDSAGKLLRELKGHQGTVYDVTFSPDDEQIATAGDDGTARIWDSTGKLLRELKSRPGRIWRVVFSPDGKQIATAGNDGTARIWDSAGKPLRELRGHQGSVYGIAFSPDGKQIATAGNDGTARIWDSAGKPLRELRGHQAPVYGVVFSSDGKRIASAAKNNNILESNDGIARIWDTTGKQLREFKGPPDSGWAVALSPDGDPITIVGRDGAARIRTSVGMQFSELKGHQGRIWTIGFSSDGKRIATSGIDGTARVWDISGKQLNSFKTRSKFARMVFSPDGQRIATIAEDSIVRIWDSTGRQLREFKLREFKGEQATIRDVAVSLNGERIATMGVADGGQVTDPKKANTTVKIWDITGKQLGELKGHQGLVLAVIFSSDGSQIATKSLDDSVRVWDITGKQLGELKGHGIVGNMSFSPDGKQIATSSNDGTVRIWDTTGKQLGELKGHQGGDLTAIFSPDGKRIATSSNDGITRIWDITGKQLAQFNQGYPITFSPDWKTIAIATTPLGSKDQIVRLYPVDLNLDSLLKRACQRLKYYILYNPDLRDDRSRCEAHLGETWIDDRQN
jgi:WD40 repeat protein